MPPAPLRSTGGFTLAEVVIGVALASMLVVILARFVSFTARASARTQVQVALQQTGALALRQVVADLRSTSVAGVSLARQLQPSRRTVVAVQPLARQFVDPSSLYDLELYVLRYHEEERRLLRQEYVSPSLPLPASATLPTRWEPQQLLSLPSATRGRALAGDVEDFQLLSAVASPNLSNPLTISIHLKRSVNGNRPADFRLQQAVFLRNAAR